MDKIYATLPLTQHEKDTLSFVISKTIEEYQLRKDNLPTIPELRNDENKIKLRNDEASYCEDMIETLKAIRPKFQRL